MICFGLRNTILVVFLVKLCAAFDQVCDRRPLGTRTKPLPPDNRFLIEIEDIRENLYIPNTAYVVHLHSRDPSYTFIAFTISLRQDQIENKNNPRKPILLKAGKLEVPLTTVNAKNHPNCNDTIIESDISAKSSVKVRWIAPDKDNKCVTIFAVVAVKPDVWYSFEDPLSKRVCEDRRKAQDMLPMENDDCRVCSDARYKLTFEGLWSYNTHPTMFPNTTKPARFSDVVGASHSKDYNLYKYNSEASMGLKMLAEQGNTTQLEVEIGKNLGQKVRTIIKATGPPLTNMTTISSFRVTHQHHLVSLATALIPSPDWFLGVAHLELCSAAHQEWEESLSINMYPMDAGTDKGSTFDAANEEMLPPQAISSADIIKTLPKELVKPFARLHFQLIRTYDTARCLTSETATGEARDGGDGESYTEEGVNGNEGGNGNGDGWEPEPQYPTVQTTTSEGPPSVDPESGPNCPVTTWEEWMPCEGDCVDGKVNGMKIRFRYHMVENVPVGKYIEGGPSYEEKEVPKICEKKVQISETEVCEDDCEDKKALAEQRMWDGEYEW
ncbi:hypothetical protein K1T71_008957 [Dendrolimus kikuchii]|uniref:Uncharacterized protein n=1 Tax=Dendrolimus kikuchii TaxID=765133 RepID=A0ACC1CWT1_9NEOP|nr:hypothetical protein K1T71_008957 [Dendrolimus kikuchii]